jgi:signal transduction histidine kinase
MLIPPDRLAEEAEILQRLRRGERIDHFDTLRMTKDRRKVEVSVTVSPIFDSEGKVIGASKIARDISGRKATERALANAHEELRRHAEELERQVEMRTAEVRESLQEMEIFASSLSHDLRGPLRTIATYAETLNHDFSKQLPSEAQHHIQRITATCGKLSRLVENVLSHARLRTGKLELVRVDLEALLEGILNEYESKATVSVERPLLPVLAQEEFLNQALSNLVSNAVKFVAPGTWPELKIWTERVDAGVRVWIEDNGIGIGQADQKKLFTLFTRLGKGVYEGTGVGLAVVRLAIRRMGGDVGVISREGGGSRFWLRLRAAEEAETGLEQAAQTQEGIISLRDALRTRAEDSGRAAGEKIHLARGKRPPR